MKYLRFFAVLSIILGIVSFSHAQDTTLNKIKLEKFKSWQRTGKIVTITGLSAAAAGIAVAAVSYSSSEINSIYGDVGVLVIGAGVLTCIPGIIYWSLGKSKTREYQIKLGKLKVGPYYTPKHSGLILTYRF